MAKKRDRTIVFMLVRYICLLLISYIMILSPLFYNLFLKLTIYPTNFLLNLFYNSNVLGDLIFAGSKTIEIIPACVAVSAYLLLLIFNLTTPMQLGKRIRSLVFSFASLLVINVLRIFFLSTLLVKDYIYFDIVHKFFWYFLSTIFVVAIWFASVAIFKIKQIPIYSDFKLLISSIKKQKTK